METSLRIITTTIILLWSIQTYKCTEGFKPGNEEKFFISFFHSFSGCYLTPDNSLLSDCASRKKGAFT